MDQTLRRLASCRRIALCLLCLALARAEGYEAYALSFRYGQRHACELEAAARVAAAGPPRRTTLHAFRIAAKQLRYTLEFLEEKIPGAPSVLATLRQFQDLSGVAHDGMELTAFVKRLSTASRPGAPVRMLVRPLEADTRRSVSQALEAAAGLLEQVRGLHATLGPLPSRKGP